MNLSHIASLKVCCHSHSDDDDEIIINVNCKYGPCARTKTEMQSCKETNIRSDQFT